MKTPLISWLIKIEDHDVLARIWCDFNGWRWPKDIPEKFKPQWWDTVFGPVTYKVIQDRKLGYMHIIMEYIESKVKKSKIDEWWQKPREIIAD